MTLPESARLPYGSWPSPLTAAWACAASPRFEGARFVGNEVWWGEGVPEEAGRTAVRRRTASGTVVDVLPAPWNARSRVHEYGGGSWTATAEGRLFFVEKADQRVWTLTEGSGPVALTPADPQTRFGGLSWQEGTLLAVREVHGIGRVPRRAIVSIAVDGSGVSTLVESSDFVAQPALSPGGRSLAWVAWNHPDMPWDRTQVRVGEIVDGEVSTWWSPTSGETSALQPVWCGEDELLFLDEPTGRWNLWSVRAGTDAVPFAPSDADTGGPLWVLGARWFSPLADGRIVAVRTNGSDELVVIGADGMASALPLLATARVLIEDVAGSRVLVSGMAPGASGVWLVDIDAATAELVCGGGSDLGKEWMPRSRPVTFAGPHGDVHAFDFPPQNPDAVPLEGELPPYVVFVHGGPTAHVGGVADSKIAFLTSRGIGVLDVNYGGSTGYGRAYRERLRGQWGVVDVDDVAAAAAGLAADGRADAARLAIAGGSAGGWTVLAALVGTDVFGAGISRYGVGDARALAEDTHDFEARYLDGLIGPLPAAEAVYLERSPLSRADGFRVPVLLLQGDEDEVVPPAQSEAIRDALAANGVPHAYVLYAGEGHGFRKAETVVDALEKELAFLGQVFGFSTPGIPPLALS